MKKTAFGAICLVTSLCGFSLLGIFNRVCPVGFVKMLIAVGFCFALGVIFSRLSRRFGVRTPIAIVTAVVSITLSVWLKWAVYDYTDIRLLYKEMDSSTAYEYFGLESFFPENDSQNWDFETAYNALNKVSRDDKSLWEYYGLDELLGDSPEQAGENFSKCKRLTAYEYIFSYSGKEQVTFGDIISSPKNLIGDIKAINAQGRWKLSGNKNVCGRLLWAIWLAEISAEMGIPILILVLNSRQSKKD